ncbi:MAG: hypothetical protein ACQES9_10660 [Myxococcota bacterium]
MYIGFRKSYVMTFLLVFSMVFQPIVFEAVLFAETNAQVSTVNDSNTQTQSASEELNAVDTGKFKIDMNWLQKLGVSIGNLFKKGLKKKIKKAQKQAKEAAAETEESKVKVAEGAEDSNAATTGTKSAVGTSRSARTKENLTAASGARSKAQAGLQKVGEQLEGVAQSLSQISMTLGVIGQACSAMSAIPYVGAVMGMVGGVLSYVSGLLSKISAVIKVAAAAVIAAANAARISDVDFDKYSEEAAEAWKNSGNENEPPEEEELLVPPEGPDTGRPDMELPENYAGDDDSYEGSPSGSVNEPIIPGQESSPDNEEPQIRHPEEYPGNRGSGLAKPDYDKIRGEFNDPQDDSE